MKAIRFHEIGKADVLRIDDVPTPMPKPGEVLIKTAYAGVNFADIGFRDGKLKVQSLPFCPGLEGSGTVDAIGAGVTTCKPGDSVLAFKLRGSYAEYFIAQQDAVFAVPGGMKMEEAATVGQIFMTAWSSLAIRGKLQRGQTALIHSAGNGVGIAAVQIAKHLGAKVIATASSPAKLQLAKSFGADELINYAQVDFAPETMRLTNNRGVDLTLDGVGGESVAKGIKCLADEGRMVLLGFSSGDPWVHFHVLDLVRGLSILFGSAGLFQLPRSEYAKVIDLFKTGAFKPVPVTVFPMTEAAAAHRYLEERKGVGKIAIKITP